MRIEIINLTQKLRVRSAKCGSEFIVNGYIVLGGGTLYKCTTSIGIECTEVTSCCVASAIRLTNIPNTADSGARHSRIARVGLYAQ